MTPERWDQICTVYNSAAEQPASRVEEFLRQACGDDLALREEVSRMLRQRLITGPLDRTLSAAAAAVAGSKPVFEAGQIVAGRYRILRYLSRGGMGEVYEARDLDLELPETVALKTLLPAIAGDEAMILQFKREIALARKVAHPNVCRVFDLSRHEVPQGRPVLFLTMEFLNGETLEAHMAPRTAMSESESLLLLRQMADALDAAHAAGVIHRDFKPSNVMLVPTANGTRAVVTDFGLARRFVTPDDATATMSKVIAGTLDYMAPELLRGSPATFASDIYALGMTAYRMAAGALPFPAETAMARAILRCHSPVPSPRTVVPGLSNNQERAILSAIDADPGKRFTSARAFVDALQGNSATPLPKLPAARRVRAIAAGVVVLAVVGGVAAGWREWRNTSLRLPPDAQVLYQKGKDDNAAGAWFAATRALGDAAKHAPHAPQIRAKLAEAWVGLDMPEKAAEEMLLVRREDTSALSKPERLQIEAIDLSITQEYPAAAARYEEIASLLPGDADIAVDLGRAYELADRPDDAVRNYRRAAEGPQHSPAAWLRLGVLYARQSKKDQADGAFDQAEHLYNLTSNLEGLTEVYLQRGIAANTYGQHDAGASFLGKALATARLQGNLQEEINATLRLSQNAYLAGDAAAADRYARDALQTARRQHFDSLAIRGLINLGNALRRKQDFAASEQNYREALDLARQTRSAHLVAVSLLSLAGLHDEMQQRDDAVREAKEALAFYQANRYAKESFQCLTLLARRQRDGGDYEGALASFRGLLKIAETGQDRAQIGAAHESIGSMLLAMDRYPEALDAYRKSVSFAVDPEHAGYASLDCGNTLWRLGNYAEAEAAYAQADANAQAFPALRLQVMYARAGMLLSQNRFHDAAELARAALAQGGDRTPVLKSQIEQLLGLALIEGGSKNEGLAKCESARTALDASGNMRVALEADVVLLEARMEAGERKSALRLLPEIQPRLEAHPELQWRALALAASADPQYAGAARGALQKLSRLWGDSAYNAYLMRPDTAKLSRPFLR